MKVRFELKLFLPFLLPRDSKEWGREAFEYDYQDLRIGLVVLPQDAATEAPKGVEDFQATHSENTSEVQTWQITKVPHKYFYEVLLIAVTGEVSDLTSIYKPEVRAKYLNVCIRTARKFLDFCRTLARDTEIYFNAPEVQPDRLDFDGFPHSQGWYDPSTRSALGDTRVNFSAGEFTTGRHGLKPIPWHQLRAAIRSGDEPPIHILTLLEAKTALAQYDNRRAVLYGAMAVEIAAKVRLHRTKIPKDILKKLDLEFDESFAEKYFDSLLRLASLPSLKESDEDLFRQVVRLARARNKVAHEGVCYVDKDNKGCPRVLTHFEVAELIGSAEKAIDWVGNLR